MQPLPANISRILEQLTQGPNRLKTATRDIPSERLYLRSEVEPWSVSDILAHLRACSDVWGQSFRAMLTQDHPTLRYLWPRAWMRKPLYADQAFATALAAFTQERQKLVKALADLDAAGCERRGTFTGTSPRQRDQTVFSYAERLAHHEQPHLDQIESLLP